VTRRPRSTQAHAPLEGAVRHRQSSEARNVQAGQQPRRGLQQRLEHPTATLLLPLRCFQVVHIPCSHAKFSHQGRVSLASTKPDPPSGAKRGGTPSASKFSSKKDLFCQNVFRAFRLLRKWILKTTEYTKAAKADRAEGLLRLRDTDTSLITFREKQLSLAQTVLLPTKKSRYSKQEKTWLYNTVRVCFGLGGRRKHTLQDNPILQARILKAKGSSSALGVDNTFGEVRPSLER
jgi:hypothetical protein